jgi:uncharacterized damage-inducible protein DinB
MKANEVYGELFGRIRPLTEQAVKDLSTDQLTTAPAAGANTIGWLAWHMSRVQDHHVAELLATDQIWVTGDWAATFGLEPDPDDTGYGHDATAVARVQPTGPDACLGYLDAVAARTATYLGSLTDDQFDAIVDRRWDPPVTLGVRLISIANDSLQHAGQAAYARGLLGY